MSDIKTIGFAISDIVIAETIKLLSELCYCLLMH